MLSKAALNRNKGSFDLFQKPITDLPPSVVMTKTMTIQLHKLFERAATPLDLKSGLLMRGAELNYWRVETGSVVEQEFDGRYGLLYSYEMKLAAETRLPLTVDGADIHGLYVMEATSAFTLCDMHGSPLCIIAPSRGRYIYLPPGDYQLEVPAGHSLLFGFYFDVGSFRDGNERGYEFLEELIRNHREQTKTPACSIDFSITANITLEIQQLCNDLKKGHFENESFVFSQLTSIMRFSKDAVFNEYERSSDPKLLILRCRQFLREGIEKNGNKTKIKTIAERLGVSYNYLNRLNKLYFKETLSDYRIDLLLERIKTLLEQPLSLLAISIDVKFHGRSELGRFFKKHSGLTPGQYRRGLPPN